MKTSITCTNISKVYTQTVEQQGNFLTTLQDHVLQHHKMREVYALQRITCEIHHGEVVALIGDNGSGKSTLLKLIAGILKPTSGHIKTNGMALFLGGIGGGLPPRLSVHDAVYLVGAILGRSRKEVRDRFDDIICFAELTTYRGAKIQHLSRGMLHRLAFAIIVHCAATTTPHVVLFDEVFSKGGDMHFREKATKKLETFIRGDAAVMLATHNPEIVRTYATRVLWIKDGLLHADGQPAHILDAYRTHTASN